jgi:transcriptional regulator with XRE-family HTH domain
MAKNAELQAFLRTRRARVQPADVGIETAGHRRVPGLRREEVAMLAGVSLDYYARLEQGRNLQPSDQVLDAIARALRLTDVERDYLHNVVRLAVPASTPSAAPAVSEPDQGLRLMLDSIQVPAFVSDVRGDVLAMNRMGEALFPGLRPAASFPRWLFLEPSARGLFAEWEMIARSSVAVLRETAGRYPRDTALYGLIGELSVVSPEFRAWWADHEVDGRCRGRKRLRHPVVGEIVVHTETLQLHGRDLWLYAYAVEPGTRSADAMRLLGTWAATDDAEAAEQSVDDADLRRPASA